jgi:MFS superfamily sulfate permease-like transporter
LIYLQTNVLWMMASILIGIGVGLVLASVFSAFQKSEST